MMETHHQEQYENSKEEGTVNSIANMEALHCIIKVF
jgi:hypothetical protein